MCSRETNTPMKSAAEKKQVKIWHPYLPDEKYPEQKPKQLPAKQIPVNSVPFPWGHALNPLQLALWSKMEQQKHLSPSGSNVFPFASFTPMSQNPLVGASTGSFTTDLANTCAHCGAGFRLTSDLVQHMRSQHRKRHREEEQEKETKKHRETQI